MIIRGVGVKVLVVGLYMVCLGVNGDVKWLEKYVVGSCIFLVFFVYCELLKWGGKCVG